MSSIEDEIGGKSAPGQNVFHHLACIYDRMNLLISFGLIHYWRGYAARYLTLKAGETALDLGTGTADLAIAIMRVSDPGARMIGIDITPTMLAQGRVKLQRRGLQARVELRVGDAGCLELPDNSVDVCCSAFLIRNLANIPQSFREMLRVVRPGGRVVCLEVSHPPGKIFRGLFHFYFYKCAPFLGTLLGQRLEAYHYLPQSLKDFPDVLGMKKLMEECGWSDVSFQRLNGGIVAIHSGTKRVLSLCTSIGPAELAD